MNQSEQSYINSMQTEADTERLRRQQMESAMASLNQQNPYLQPNIIEYQLDLAKELESIANSFSGKELKPNKEGNIVWVDSKDDRLKILSDYGIKQLMNFIAMYLNKNTLLANYDEETIQWKVYDFANELADLIFNKYEDFFFYPTPEELFKKSIGIIREYPEKFPAFVDENGVNETLLFKKCEKWSNEELQNKYKHYPMIVLSITDSIHSTFLRAWRGQERESLRKQYNIHQSLDNKYGYPEQNQNKINKSIWKG